MISAAKVVIYRFRNTDNSDFGIYRLEIIAKLLHRIHRVISADIENVTDIKAFKMTENFFVYFLVFRTRGQLFSARAQGTSRG